MMPLHHFLVSACTTLPICEHFHLCCFLLGNSSPLRFNAVPAKNVHKKRKPPSHRAIKCTARRRAAQHPGHFEPRNPEQICTPFNRVINFLAFVVSMETQGGPFRIEHLPPVKTPFGVGQRSCGGRVARSSQLMHPLMHNCLGIEPPVTSFLPHAQHAHGWLHREAACDILDY